jgi:formylglycine-generating enzyme required for sulfatase activity
MMRLMIALAILQMVAMPGWSAEPAALPMTKIRIPGSTVEYELVKIPAGKIEMASGKDGEAPKVVEIKSLWIGKLEVTWECYGWWAFGRGIPAAQRYREVDAKTLPSIPYRDAAEGWGQDDQPAIRMTLESAQMYCDWLSKQTGRKFRLPTEAEWEYACRAGGPPLQQLSEERLNAVAWYEKNSEERAHPGGQKKPNRWGLHDMLGNLAEWVQPEDGKRFTKGGAWNSPGERVNSTGRMYFKSDWQRTDPEDPKSRWWLSDGPFVGFRVVMEE